MASCSSDVVLQTVHAQRTSPDFAEFCIAHVTDPAYKFLFGSARDSEERRLYVEALQNSSGTCNTNESNCLSGGVTSCSGKAPARAVTLFAGQSKRSHGGAFMFSRYDVRTLWDSIYDTLVHPVITPHSESDSPNRKVIISTVHGPHAPHVFFTPLALQRFMEDALKAAGDPSDVAVKEVVNYMQEHIVMTETFLFVLNYIVAELLHYATIMRDNNTDGDGGFREEEDVPPLKRSRTDEHCASEVPHSRRHAYTEAAGTIVYMVTRLFAIHRDHAANISEVGESRTQCYYQDVFEHYIQSIISSFTTAVEALPELRAHDGFVFVVDTLNTWDAEACFSPRVSEVLHKASQQLHMSNL